MEGRVGGGAHGERARALREGLPGPARVEERGGEGGGDLGAPRREPRRAAERRDRVPCPRERGARVAEDVVRERGAPVARGEALRRGAVVFADGQGAQGGLRLLAEGGGRVLPVRIGRCRRRRRGVAPVPGNPSLVLPASHGGGDLPGRRAGEVGESGGITNDGEEREATKLTSNDSSRGRGPTCHCKTFFEPILCVSFLLKLKTDLCASSF